MPSQNAIEIPQKALPDLKKIAELDGKAPKEKAVSLEQNFNELASTWYRETRMLSFARQKALHPSYQRIIGMGKDALPFIFRELSNGKGDWMWALESIARLDKNPVPPNATFKEARAIWIQWGKDNGYHK
jgi:hypothetical protein